MVNKLLNNSTNIKLQYLWYIFSESLFYIINNNTSDQLKIISESKKHNTDYNSFHSYIYLNMTLEDFNDYLNLLCCVKPKVTKAKRDVPLIETRSRRRSISPFDDDYNIKKIL